MKRLVRETIFGLFFLLFIHKWFQRKQKDSLTILLYHGVAPRQVDGIYNYRKKNIDTESFKRHLSYLSRHYTIITLEEAVDALTQNQPLPKYPLVITFDDGYQNNLQHAAPILQHHAVPATIFLATNFIDKKEPLWVDRLEYAINYGGPYKNLTLKEKTALDATLREKFKQIPDADREKSLDEFETAAGCALGTFENEQASHYAPLTWEEVSKAKQNNITFGAHTESHPILTRLTEEEATSEIMNSFAILTGHTQHPSKVFAYPNGTREDFNDTIKSILKHNGFSAALTTISGQNTTKTDRFALHRFSMDGTDDMLSFIMRVTGTHTWLQNLLKKH